METSPLYRYQNKALVQYSSTPSMYYHYLELKSVLILISNANSTLLETLSACLLSEKLDTVNEVGSSRNSECNYVETSRVPTRGRACRFSHSKYVLSSRQHTVQ